MTLKKLIISIGLVVLPFGVCNGRLLHSVQTPGGLIRVAIIRHVDHVNLDGNVKVGEDNIFGRHIIIKPTQAGFEIGGRSFGMPQLTATAEGVVSLNGKKYLGEIRFYKEADNEMTVVNILPLEEYLVGLVAKEMPTDWPVEAIKAQSVAARTYAMFQKQGRKHLNYDVEATTVDQVYEGIPKNAERVRGAVKNTAGEVLTLRGKLFKAFFHSTCGGQTETALNVWNKKNDFHVVRDDFCAGSPHASWKFTMNKSSLAAKLRGAGFAAATVKSINLEKRRNNPRAASVIIDTGDQTIYLQGNDFRRIIGYERLKSAWFNVRLAGADIVFEGRGYGHGVGMCQWGAKGMAVSGKAYRDILKFYYPWTRLEKL